MITPKENIYIKSLGLAKQAEDEIRRVWHNESKKIDFIGEVEAESKFGALDVLTISGIIILLWNIFFPGNKDVGTVVGVFVFLIWIVIAASSLMFYEQQRILSGKANILCRGAIRYCYPPKRAPWLTLMHKSITPALIIPLFYSGFTKTAIGFALVAICATIGGQVIISRVRKKIAILSET